MAKARIAGIILAGGKSSRMGESKALLKYNNKPLIEHMRALLRITSVSDVYISGEVEGYSAIPDNQKFNGPACAIMDVFEHLKDYDAALFVPVDMPLLSAGLLQVLLDNPKGAYFNKSPLPAFINKPIRTKDIYSVKQLLDEQGVEPINLPEEYKDQMQNFNTPEDWQKL